MNTTNHQFCFTLLLMVFFSVSCSRQDKTSLTKTEINTPNKVKNLGQELLPDEVDPYFNGHQNITTIHGPRTISRNIIQDNNGIMWFATWDGIVSYNGIEFTNHTNKESLRRYRIFSILEEKKGGIWFGSIGAGIYHYNGKAFKNITKKDGLINDRVGCIFEDKEGNIWFGTEQGISCYDGKNFTNFGNEEGLINKDVNAILQDKEGKIWVATRGGVYFLQDHHFIQFMNKDGKPFTNIRTIIRDKKDNIWIGGADGLWCFDDNNYTNYSSNFIGNLYEDKKSKIWFSAGGENLYVMTLNYIDPNLPTVLQPNPKVILQSDGQVFGITEDKKGHIWFGLANGIGKFDGKSFEYFRNVISD